MLALEELGERKDEVLDYAFSALTPEYQQKYLAYFNLKYLHKDHPVHPSLLRAALRIPLSRTPTPVPPGEGESVVKSIFANPE